MQRYNPETSLKPWGLFLFSLIGKFLIPGLSLDLLCEECSGLTKNYEDTGARRKEDTFGFAILFKFEQKYVASELHLKHRK